MPASADDSSSPTERPRTTSLLVPVTIAAGFFMEGMDSTILNTAVPQIAATLHTSAIALSMAVTSYLLSLAVFIPLSGWIADRFGARRVFTAALILFTLGSALCGLAVNLPMLVATRVLQGFGGAMMTPVGRLILARSFPKDQLIVAMNYMLLPGLVGPMLGPGIGGFITTYVSWRWVFYVNIPIGLAGLVMAIALIPPIQSPPPARFDFRGFIILGLGLAACQVAIECLGRHIVSGVEEASIAALAVAALALYGFHAQHRAHPVLDLSLFRIRSFAVSILAGNVSRLGVMGTPYLLPLLFQIGFGLNAFHSGLLVCISTAGAFFMRIGVPRLMRALGLRRILIGNGILLALLLAGLGLFRAETPKWVIAAYLFFFGFSRIVQMSSIGALSFDLPSELMSKATSIAAVAQRLAQSLAVGLAATLLTVLSRDSRHLSETDFRPVFVAVALIELCSIVGFMRLTASDGRDLTGHGAEPRSG